MVKKLTITISDDVHKRLENFRKEISISAICTNALKKQVDSFEENVLAAKKRLNLLSIEEAEELAFEEGVHWAAYEATIEQMAIVCEGHKKSNTNIFDATSWYVDTKVVKELLGSNDDYYTYIYGEGFISDYLLDSFEEEHHVIFPFCDGASVIWKRIKEEILMRR